MQVVGLIGGGFGISVARYFLTKRDQTTRRSRVTAPADQEPFKLLGLGLGLGFGLGVGLYVRSRVGLGLACKAEVDLT